MTEALGDTMKPPSPRRFKPKLTLCRHTLIVPQIVSPLPAQEPIVQHLPQPILLLINGNSRQGQEQFGPALAMLREAGIEIKEAILARDVAETERLLKREIAAKANMIIAGGGDGTLSTCAHYLAGTNVAMAVLPLGTGNTFARSLGLPLDLEEAIATIAAGHIESIDVGKCNGQVFLNSVSLGFSASLAGMLTGEIKKKLGLLAWPYTGVKLALRHRPLFLRVASEQKSFVSHTHQLLVANGRYVAGSIKSDEDASVQDHELRVFALGGASRGDFVKSIWQWLRHSAIDAPGSQHFQTQKLRVRSLGRRARANVDGDLSQTTPLDIELWPQGLRVVVPRGFVADEV